MIDHTGILVADWAKSKAFYDAAFAPLGYTLLAEVPVEYTGGVKVGGYGKDKPDFWLTESQDVGPGRHYAFVAKSTAEVDAFYAAAMASGGKDNGGALLRCVRDRSRWQQCRGGISWWIEKPIPEAANAAPCDSG